MLNGCTTTKVVRPVVRPLANYNNMAICKILWNLDESNLRAKMILFDEIKFREINGYMKLNMCSEKNNPANRVVITPYKSPVIPRYTYVRPTISTYTPKIEPPKALTENDELLLQIDLAKESAIREIKKEAFDILEENHDLKKHIEDLDEIDKKYIITSEMW
jgi:hypothetical protein